MTLTHVSQTSEKLFLLLAFLKGLRAHIRNGLICESSGQWCMQRDVDGAGERNGWASGRIRADTKAVVAPSYLCLKGKEASLGSGLWASLYWKSAGRWRGWWDRLTSAYLSVVSHDDQLHILGCSLGMAFMLQEVNEREWTGNSWMESRKGWKMEEWAIWIQEKQMTEEVEGANNKTINQGMKRKE